MVEDTEGRKIAPSSIWNHNPCKELAFARPSTHFKQPLCESRGGLQGALNAVSGLNKKPGPKPLKECHRPTSFPRRLCTSSGCSCCLVPASRAAPLRIKPEHILIPVIQRPQLLSLLHPRTPSSLVRLPAQGVLRNQICHQRTEIGHAEALDSLQGAASSLKNQVTGTTGWP